MCNKKKSTQWTWRLVQCASKHWKISFISSPLVSSSLLLYLARLCCMHWTISFSVCFMKYIFLFHSYGLLYSVLWICLFISCTSLCCWLVLCVRAFHFMTYEIFIIPRYFTLFFFCSSYVAIASKENKRQLMNWMEKLTSKQRQ